MKKSVLFSVFFAITVFGFFTFAADKAVPKVNCEIKFALPGVKVLTTAVKSDFPVSGLENNTVNLYGVPVKIDVVENCNSANCSSSKLNVSVRLSNSIMEMSIDTAGSAQSLPKASSVTLFVPSEGTVKVICTPKK